MTSPIETIVVNGGIVEQLRRHIQERNIRQIIIKQRHTPVAAFPAIDGVLSSAVQSAIGALAITLADCTIEIERSLASALPGELEFDMIDIHWIGVPPWPEGVN